MESILIQQSRVSFLLLWTGKRSWNSRVNFTSQFLKYVVSKCSLSQVSSNRAARTFMRGIYLASLHRTSVVLLRFIFVHEIMHRGAKPPPVKPESRPITFTVLVWRKTQPKTVLSHTKSIAQNLITTAQNQTQYFRKRNVCFTSLFML